jgi:hypothetical protein
MSMYREGRALNNLLTQELKQQMLTVEAPEVGDGSGVEDAERKAPGSEEEIPF